MILKSLATGSLKQHSGVTPLAHVSPHLLKDNTDQYNTAAFKGNIRHELILGEVCKEDTYIEANDFSEESATCASSSAQRTPLLIVGPRFVTGTAAILSTMASPCAAEAL